MEKGIRHPIIEWTAAAGRSQLHDPLDLAVILEHDDIDLALDDVEGLALAGMFVRPDVGAGIDRDDHLVQRIIAVGMGIDAGAPLGAGLDRSLEGLDFGRPDGCDRSFGQEHLRRFLDEAHGAGSFMMELSSAA